MSSPHTHTPQRGRGGGAWGLCILSFLAHSGLCYIYLFAFNPPLPPIIHPTLSILWHPALVWSHRSGVWVRAPPATIPPPCLRACSRLLTKIHDPFIGFMESKGGVGRIERGEQKSKDTKVLYLEGKTLSCVIFVVIIISMWLCLFVFLTCSASIWLCLCWHTALLLKVGNGLLEKIRCTPQLRQGVL